MLTQSSFSFLLLFCYFLQQFTKTSLVPRSPFFLPSISSSLALSATTTPLSAAYFFPLTTLGSVCVSFWVFKVNSQSYTLSLVHLFQPLTACFSTHYKLTSFTSSLPMFFFLFIPRSLSLFCLFSFLRVLHCKHSVSHGNLKSPFLMQANCHIQMHTPLAM